MEGDDKGHIRLVKELQAMLALAEAYEFHDFKNNKFAAPKMELVSFLTNMVNKAKRGTYDN